MPTVAFNICCPRDCVSRHNGGTSVAPLKPPRDDSARRAISTLRGLRGAPAVPPLYRETQSLAQQMLNAPLGINGLRESLNWEPFRPCLPGPVCSDYKRCAIFFISKVAKFIGKMRIDMTLIFQFLSFFLRLSFLRCSQFQK